MKWTSELTVKEHLGFMKTIERSTADIGAVLTCYESQKLFEIMRDLTDDELFKLKERDDVYGTIMHVYETRLSSVLLQEEKPKDRILTGEILRQQVNQLIGSIEMAAGDHITYMAYCEYIALCKEGQADALNATWEEWQEDVQIEAVLESFYRKVADERIDQWRKSLEVEKRQKINTPEPEEDIDIPLASNSSSSL